MRSGLRGRLGPIWSGYLLTTEGRLWHRVCYCSDTSQRCHVAILTGAGTLGGYSLGRHVALITVDGDAPAEVAGPLPIPISPGGGISSRCDERGCPGDLAQSRFILEKPTPQTCPDPNPRGRLDRAREAVLCHAVCSGEQVGPLRAWPWTPGGDGTSMRNCDA